VSGSAPGRYAISSLALSAITAKRLNGPDRLLLSQARARASLSKQGTYIIKGN